MFIDYLTLMLVNLAAGLVFIAIFVFKYMDGDRRTMAPGFLMSGFLSLATGLHEIFTWPVPGSYNIAFGEMAVFFGLLLLAAGLAFLFDWDLLTIGIYAAFVGVASIVIGARLIDRGMTTRPLVAGLGFIGTGLAAILTLPVYYLRRYSIVRILAALFLVGCAAVWAFIGYLAYWGHLEAFAKWTPPTMPIPKP